MSGFYEVTAASGTAATGDRSKLRHNVASVIASHPVASRTLSEVPDGTTPTVKHRCFYDVKGTLVSRL